MTPLDRRSLPAFLLFIVLLGPFSPSHGETLPDLFEKAHITFLQRPRVAHDFVLSDLTGHEIRLGDLRGKIVCLNIWATWCAPCRQEMPSMERLHRHFAGREFMILAVSVDMAEIEIVKAFREKHNYTFTVLHDPRGHIMEWFRVRLIPVTYLIDKSGKMIGKAVGPRQWDDESTLRLIEALLKRSDEKP